MPPIPVRIPRPLPPTVRGMGSAQHWCWASTGAPAREHACTRVHDGARPVRLTARHGSAKSPRPSAAPEPAWRSASACRRWPCFFLYVFTSMLRGSSSSGSRRGRQGRRRRRLRVHRLVLRLRLRKEVARWPACRAVHEAPFPPFPASQCCARAWPRAPASPTLAQPSRRLVGPAALAARGPIPPLLLCSSFPFSAPPVATNK